MDEVPVDMFERLPDSLKANPEALARYMHAARVAGDRTGMPRTADSDSVSYINICDVKNTWWPHIALRFTGWDVRKAVYLMHSTSQECCPTMSLYQECACVPVKWASVFA